MEFEFNKLFGGVQSEEKDASAVFDNVQRYFNTFQLDGNNLDEYNKSLYVFAAVSKIAQNIASCDLQLYEIVNTDGEREQVKNHEALDKLYSPNPFETKTEFWETLSINLSLSGDSYILKVRGENTDEVQELYNLRPDKMRVVSGTNELVDRYEFTHTSGITKFQPEDIIHIRYPSPLSRLVGTSPIEAASDRVETEEQATEYQKNMFKNNARPDFILESEQQLQEKQKENLKRSWNKANQGAKNAGAMAVLEGGLSYKQVSVSPREMDWIESLKHTRDDILVAFGVPKPVIADIDEANLSNAETADRIFMEQKIYPEMQRIVEKLNHDFVQPEYGQEYELEAVDPTPENQEKKLQKYEAALENNWMVPNEIRMEEGLEPLQGGWSTYRKATETAVGGVPEENRKSAEDEPQHDNLHGKEKLQLKLQFKEDVKDHVKQTLVRGAKKEVKKKAIERGKLSDDGVVRFVEDKVAWAKGFIKQMDNQAEQFQGAIEEELMKQRDRVLEAIKDRKAKDLQEKGIAEEIFDKGDEDEIISDFSLPFIQDFVEQGGEEAFANVDPAADFTVTNNVREFIQNRADDLATQVNSTTLKGLENTLSEGIAEGEGTSKLANRVEEEYDKIARYRSRRIARTETTVANNEGLMRGYQQSGVVNAKEWVAVMDSRTRPSHAATHGEVVGLDETFSNGLMRPGQPNCRCVVNGVFQE